MTVIHALAPAKLNLGLEVVGKRADGFHDIVSVMQTVSIFDRLSVRPSDRTSLCVDDSSLATDDNLVLTAAKTFRNGFPALPNVAIELRKRIPAAAGLGGASSDAAATISALAEMLDIEPGDPKVESVAVQVGSDVSFLLTGGTALVSGRGDIIHPLQPLVPVWFIVLSPAIAIPRKTASLYAALQPDYFSSGGGVREIAARIERGQPLDPAALGNAFLRPLCDLRPELAWYEEQFRSSGAPFVALSGAGPSLYTGVRTVTEAFAITHRLRRTVSAPDRLMICRPVGRSPILRPVDDSGTD